MFDAEGIRIVDIACGDSHVVALADSGVIYCWGGRVWLEPHTVTVPSRYENGIKNLTQVKAGKKSCYALTEEGHLYSWVLGKGVFKKKTDVLHQDEKEDSLTPQLVDLQTYFSGEKVRDLAAGPNNSVVALTGK